MERKNLFQPTETIDNQPLAAEIFHCIAWPSCYPQDAGTCNPGSYTNITTTKLNRTMSTKTCSYCATAYNETSRHCPLCRRPSSNNSGRHDQHIAPKLPAIVESSLLGRHAQVIINRGQVNVETFIGTVVGVTTAGVNVRGDSTDAPAEWFPFRSANVQTNIKGFNA